MQIWKTFPINIYIELKRDLHNQLIMPVTTYGTNHGYLTKLLLIYCDFIIEPLREKSWEYLWNTQKLLLAYNKEPEFKMWQKEHQCWIGQWSNGAVRWSDRSHRERTKAFVFLTCIVWTIFREQLDWTSTEFHRTNDS